MDDIAVGRESKVLHALLFETDRAPYTVYVPGPDGNPTDRLEVPYRVAAGTRSARREDLLRILVPKAAQPSLEILKCNIVDRLARLEKALAVEVVMYCTPGSAAVVALPAHKLQAELFSNGSPLAVRAEDISVSTSGLKGPTEVLISAPSSLYLWLHFRGEHLTLDGVSQLKLVFRWTPGGGDTPAVAETTLLHVGGGEWRVRT